MLAAFESERRAGRGSPAAGLQPDLAGGRACLRRLHGRRRGRYSPSGNFPAILN